jgi:hypothetical protein
MNTRHRGTPCRAAAIKSALLGLSLLLLAGCDSGKKVPPPWGGLSGSVTLSGKPAKEVTVVFENRQSGVALTNTTDDNGHFEIRSAESAGLPVGDYKISIVPTYHLVPTDGLAIKGPHPEANFAVPAKYQEAKTSGLTCIIHEGQNSLDLAMTP